jgi:iron(III) transport system permease protein
MHRSGRIGDGLAVGVAGLVACGLVAVPLVRLLQVLIEQHGHSVGRVLHRPGLAAATMHTTLLVCVVPVLAVALGSTMALALRADLPLRRLLQVLVVLPLVVPQFVLGYSWTQAYGRGGFTDSMFGLRWAGLEGPVGIIVVLVVDTAPVSFLLTAAGLAVRAQPDLEHAARLSGASGWTALRTVTLPLLRPVFAAELALSFVATLESFAVPQVLGTPAGFSTLTTRIYADLALASDPDSFVDALTLAAALVAIVAVVLLPADVVLAPKLRAARTGRPSGVAAVASRRGPATAVGVAISGYTVLAVGLPTVALVAAAVTKAVGVPPTPSNWTLANFRSALSASTVDAIGNSGWLAVCAACALTALGALVAALERRRAGRTLGTVAILTFAIPGSALAVALLISYGRWLGGGLALILVAYLAKFWALAHRAVSGAVDRLPVAEWQAARTSGARPAVAVRTIWLPALGPALLGAWLLVFVTALHEVTMSSLLYSVGNQTLAVVVLNTQELGDVGATAALSVVLTALVVGAGLLVWLPTTLLMGRHRGAAPALRPARRSVQEAVRG